MLFPVLFTDIDRNAVDVIKANLKTTGLFNKARVIQIDAISFLKSTDEMFDLVFS